MSQGMNMFMTMLLQGDYTGPAVAGVSPTTHQSLQDVINMTSGSGALQCDLFVAHAISLAASGSETLDLTALTDPLGVAASFARVKGIFLFPDATNVNDIIIGAAGSTPFVGPFGGTAPTFAVSSNGQFGAVRPDATGWVVGANKNLKLANSGSGTGVTGKLLLYGCAE